MKNFANFGLSKQMQQNILGGNQNDNSKEDANKVVKKATSGLKDTLKTQV
jgi:hypothetical protein